MTNIPSQTPVIPGAKSSAYDLIRSALRLINAIAPGETPTGEEVNDALVTLNQMIDHWNAERLMIFTVGPTLFVPATLKQAYTLGPNGDFDAPRPPRITGVSVQNLANPQQPLELPLEYLTDDGWQSIPVKNIPSALPTTVWDDGGFPFRTLYFYPVPSVPVNFIVYSWSQLTQFVDTKTIYTFPPGYLQALRFSLAILLGPEYETEVRADVIAIAQASMATIKTMNSDPIVMKCDPALVDPKKQVYNWLSDTPLSR